MLNQVQKYIYQALNIHDNVRRPQAESNLFHVANQNTTEFFLTLATIISNDAKDLITRQSTGTVFSRFVTFKCDQNLFYWDRVHHETKPIIKEMLLSTLISSDISIMKTGANAIAHITSIQIPRGEWLDIVNTLAENAQHDQYNIRMASVITLGYICQELKNSKSIINDESCQQILGGLLMSLQKEGQIVQLALAALRDSIQFLRLILQNREYCNKTFQFILPLLEHPQIRQKVYQILFQFCKYCYHLVENYLQLIIQFTLAHIQQRNQDSIHALALWETIGTEYLQRKGEINDRLNEKTSYILPNIIVESHKKILPQVMGCILIVNNSDYQFPELREEAVNTLTVMVECGNREMVQIITEGVSKILQSSNPGERQASGLLFSCLCSFQDKDDICNRFYSGFTHLFKLLQDPEILVLKNSLSGFVTLSESFPEVFLTNAEIKDIFFHLLNLASNTNQDISILSLSILCNITESLGKHPDPIASDPKDIISQAVKMFSNGLKTQINKQANQKLIVLLMNIIMSTPNISIINQLTLYLIQLYHQYASKHIQDKQIILEHIVTVLHTCLLAISKFPLPKTEFKDAVYQLIDQHIRINGIEQEGINLISAASTCFKKDFKYKIDQYWDKILAGLSLLDQKLTFKACLTCVSDIARNHQSEVCQKISKVFQILVRYMHQNIDRQLKTDILKCFGDLTLGLKKYCQRYVDSLLQISQNCINAVYSFSQSQNEKGYAQQLKEALIQMYHCLVFAVNDQQRCNNKMAQHFQNISTFIVKSCDVKYKPTVDYLKSCLYLICDSALFYSKNAYFSKEVITVVESREIGNLLEVLYKYKEGRPDVNDVLIYAQDKIRTRR